MTMCASFLSDIDEGAGGKYAVIKTRAIICHALIGICSLFFQETMKIREVIPHIGPIPIVIPLKLFLGGIDFLADNVTSRVTRLSPFLILQLLHTHTRP